MGIRYCIIVIAIFIFGLFPLSSSVTADDELSLSINMLEEPARMRFDSPVIVAGVWHNIIVSLEEQPATKIDLIFYKGTSIPAIGNRDVSNYYEWKYDINTLEWTDESEYDYTFVNTEYCEKTGSTYTFCVGVSDTLPDILDYYENWTLEIYSDTSKIQSENVILEKPLIGLSRTHADIIRLYVDPFTEKEIVGDDYFIGGNVGNIPLTISVDYGTYNNIIEVSNTSQLLTSDSTSRHDITMESESWRPGILEIPGSISGAIPDFLIITTAVITFETNITINAANLEIHIGHSNYKIQPISGTNIVFQYEENLEMNEGEKKDIIVFISGDGNAILDISSDKLNVEIIEISSRDQSGTPLTITSTNTSEYAVTVKVEALREGYTGKIYYHLTVDGETQTYETQIKIGPPASGDSEGIEIPLNMVVVALLIFIVVGYIISSQIRYRRR